jgi:magnesium-transporting ATPase (P-type)
VNTVVFDKTGTLTTDGVITQGLLLDSELSLNSLPLSGIVDPSEIHGLAQIVIAGCHSLARVLASSAINESDVDSLETSLPLFTIIGDPIEVSALNSIRWTLDNSSSSIPLDGQADEVGHGRIESNHSNYVRRPIRVSILKSYHFDPSLRRMTVIANVSWEVPPIDVSENVEHANVPRIVHEIWLLMKGAPESIAPFVVSNSSLVSSNVSETESFTIGSSNATRVSDMAGFSSKRTIPFGVEQAWYDHTVLNCSLAGARILGLGGRRLRPDELRALFPSPKRKPRKISSDAHSTSPIAKNPLDRATLESRERLEFGGFLLFRAGLRPDAVTMVIES